MNQKFRWKARATCVVLLSCMISNALADEVKTLKCSAPYKGIMHRLAIEAGKDGIVSFDYVSFTRRGNDCGYDAKRVEKESWATSDWRDGSNGTEVEMKYENRFSANALIKATRNGYELRILKTAGNACGIGVFIAPAIRLVVGKKRCEFPVAEDPVLVPEQP